MQFQAKTQTLEDHFFPYRKNVVGIDQFFESVNGTMPIVYADWTASGRIYAPIEQLLLDKVAPFVANTHTETTVTGSTMTQAYHEAFHIIKQHVNAGKEDVIIVTGSGMTGGVNKLQRILGLRVYEKFASQINISENERPIIFVSHMEHHSNHTSWLETLADVQVIRADIEGLPDLNHLAEMLESYKDRCTKIASITSCSNVTGIRTPYYQVAEMMHKHNGLCFVDFACSAPYIDIDMHPENALQKLDAIFFSPHKFLGGPGTPGVLIFDKSMYHNTIPDNPGGGTVQWTNPWKEHRYIDDIEAREDGGTPAFLQTIKAALAIKLKEEMGVQNMLQREHEMMEMVWHVFDEIPNLHVLAEDSRDRLGVFSFYIEDLHYNLAVRLLNDKFGVQVRGGCSCAGTYGHYLLHVTKKRSHSMTSRIDGGDFSAKLGWVRMSIHPIMSNEELQYILYAIRSVAENFVAWEKEYNYDVKTNEFIHYTQPHIEKDIVGEWFDTKWI